MKYYEIHKKILAETHVLIAGTPGSGKSVLLNGLIYSALAFHPEQYKLILIDPKKVELSKYKNTPHCLGYADSPTSINQLLKATCQLMDGRYTDLQKSGADKTGNNHIWIMVDEMVDLSAKLERDKVTREIKKEIEQSLVRLLSLGRAAGIHCVLCTQRPTSDIITGVIKANITSMVAMRTRSAQDSRNILDESGAERLPRYGKALYYSPSNMQTVLINVPFIQLDLLKQRAEVWSGHEPGERLKPPPAVESRDSLKVNRRIDKVAAFTDNFFKAIWHV